MSVQLKLKDMAESGHSHTKRRVLRVIGEMKQCVHALIDFVRRCIELLCRRSCTLGTNAMQEESLGEARVSLGAVRAR